VYSFQWDGIKCLKNRLSINSACTVHFFDKLVWSLTNYLQIPFRVYKVHTTDNNNNMFAVDGMGYLISVFREIHSCTLRRKPGHNEMTICAFYKGSVVIPLQQGLFPKKIKHEVTYLSSLRALNFVPYCSPYPHVILLQSLNGFVFCRNVLQP